MLPVLRQGSWPRSLSTFSRSRFFASSAGGVVGMGSMMGASEEKGEFYPGGRMSDRECAA